MESDRTAVLFVEASARGLIDFAKGRLRDIAWWKRTYAVLRSLARQLDAQSIDVAYRYQLALVANGSLTPESFAKAQEAAREQYLDLIGCFRPWDGKGFVERKKSELKDGRQAYIDAFGVDPLDPAFKAWEAERIRRLKAGEFDERTEDSEAVVTKRLQERILKR